MRNLYLSWDELKIAALRGIHIFYSDLGETGSPAFTAYTLYSIEDDNFYTVSISNSTDSEDFETNYKSDATAASNHDYVLGFATIFKTDFTITWDEAKTIQTNTQAPFYYAQIGTSPDIYAVYLATYKFTFATLVIKPADVTDFETNYQSSAISSTTPAGALAKAVTKGASTSSLAVSVRQRDEPGFMQWTIVTHDYTDKTTWYQKSTITTDEVLSAAGGNSFSSANANWINPDHPKLYNQSYNEGVPPYGQKGLWMPDGSREAKSTFRPIIKIDDVIQNSGYTINYETGVVTFGSTVTGVVKATYYKAVTSEFIIVPPSGVIWTIPRVEVNTTSSLIFDATTYFQYWRDPTYTFSNTAFMLSEMLYQSMPQLQASATVGADVYPAMGGTGIMDASAENGWGTNYSRGTGQQAVILPWEYRKPFIMKSSLNDTIRISTTSHKKHLGADFLTATFYIEETEE